MTIDAYMNPEFTWIKKIIFLLAAIVGIVICLFFIYAGTLFITPARRRKEDGNYITKKYNKLVQLFCEMVISATSVMSFACAYVICNHIYALVISAGIQTGGYGIFAGIWGNWKDFALLVLICLSCVLNTILDKYIIPLKHLSRSEKATIRMLAMFYAIVILIYLNIIGDESEYSPVMMYYLGLMVGRFVYFDASFRDFIENIKNVFLKLPLLVMGLVVSGSLCYLGFKVGFLLERNYYIVGVFYTHLFLLFAIFIFNISHAVKMMIKPTNNNKNEE